VDGLLGGWAGLLLGWPSSRAGSRAEASRLGSARCLDEPNIWARLGSFKARELLRAEPSCTEPEPAHEPRAFFPALILSKLAAVEKGKNQRTWFHWTMKHMNSGAVILFQLCCLSINSR